MPPLYPPAGGGGGGAPTGAQYVTLALDGGLSAERTLAVGTSGPGLSLTDGGANGNVTVDILNELWGICTADTTVNNSTTLVDITGMSFALGASATEIWQIEIQLFTLGPSTTPDWKVGLSVPAGATYNFGTHSATPGADFWGLDTSVAQLALSTTTVSLGSAGVTGGLYYRGFVLGGGTSGSVKAQFAQNTANASNSTVKKGSVMLARKVVA